MEDWMHPKSVIVLREIVDYVDKNLQAFLNKYGGLRSEYSIIQFPTDSPYFLDKPGFSTL